jgi:hypothetical protein
MKFVIAGNRSQATAYVRREFSREEDVRIIDRPDDLRGYQMCPSDVFFVGTWFQRGDLITMNAQLKVGFLTCKE